MSSAKAALESDTRTLAFEAGRKFGVRVNTISAGPLASRAASAIGIIEKMVEYVSANAPLTEKLTAEEVGQRRRRSCARRWRAGSPGTRCTSTKATTRWAWRCLLPEKQRH